MKREEIESRIEQTFSSRASRRPQDFEEWFQPFIKGLNAGAIRSAQPVGERWEVNAWVKKGILLGFRYGELSDYGIDDSFRFYDKNTYPLRPTVRDENVRIVPGGTSVRTGSYLGKGVVIMPPAYVNVGAYVGEQTMIDSHALVGSCAQVGRQVHLSAAAQIGGVLEPVGALPVIVEDEVMVGGNCGIYEGTIVGRRAVLGAGTILTASIPVYDLVHGKVLRAAKGQPLEIPADAVVIPGSRPVVRSDFAVQHELSVACALIVKYRDERTDAATVLEEFLR